MAEQGGSAANGWPRAVAIHIPILLAALAVAEAILRVIDLRYLRIDESGVQPAYAHDAEIGLADNGIDTP